MHHRARDQPNSPPKRAGSSTVDNASRTSSAATSAAHTCATPSNGNRQYNRRRLRKHKTFGYLTPVETRQLNQHALAA